MGAGRAVVNGPWPACGAKRLAAPAGCNGYAGWPAPRGSWYPLRMDPTDATALDAPPTTTAAAVIADCTPPEQRKRGMALIGAAFGVGFTFGPLIAYWAIRNFQHHGAVGYVAAALSFVALVTGLILMPETRGAGRQSERRGW